MSVTQPWDGSKIVRSCPPAIVIGILLTMFLSVIMLGVAARAPIPGRLHTRYVSLAGETVPDDVPSNAVSGLLIIGGFIGIIASFATLTGRRWAFYLVLFIGVIGTAKGAIAIAHSHAAGAHGPYFDLEFLPFFFLTIGFFRYQAFAQFKRYRRKLKRSESSR